MLAPNAEIIEYAAERLGTLPKFIRDSQLLELKSFGDGRAKEIGASGVTDDFMVGYELGLQAARAIIATSPGVLLAGIDPQEIL